VLHYILINKIKVFFHLISHIVSKEFLLTYCFLQLANPDEILINLIAFITPQNFWVYTIKIGVDTQILVVSTLKSCVDKLQMWVVIPKFWVSKQNLCVYTQKFSVVTPNPSVCKYICSVDTQNFHVALQINNLSSNTSLAFTTMTALLKMLYCNTAISEKD